MSRWRKTQEQLNAAKSEAKGNPALIKTIDAVQNILDDLMAKERKEADARIAKDAVRVKTTVG